MKLTKTLVVVGLLAVGGTAANASTLGWSSSWNNFGSSNYSSQVRSQRVVTIASTLFNRYGYEIRSNLVANQQVQTVLARIQNRLVVGNHGNSGSSASEVPLPASGLLLMGALGALALRRRSKS